ALHDYLAASYIADETLDALLAQRAAEERWREVILIAIGLVQSQQRAAALLRALLDQSGHNLHGLELAGRSLAEDIQVEAGPRAEVKQRLLARLQVSETGSEYARLSAALMAADPDAARAWMHSI